MNKYPILNLNNLKNIKNIEYFNCKQLSSKEGSNSILKCDLVLDNSFNKLLNIKKQIDKKITDFRQIDELIKILNILKSKNLLSDLIQLYNPFWKSNLYYIFLVKLKISMIQQPDKAVGGNIPNLVLIKPVQDIQIIKDRKTSRNYIIIETYDIWEKYIKPLQEIDICHNKYNQYELIEDEYNYWHSRYNAGLTFTTSNGLKVFFYPLYEKNLPVSIPSGKAKLIYLLMIKKK